LYRSGFILEPQYLSVIKQIIQILSRKRQSGKYRKTESSNHIPLSIYDDGITFGYARDGESIDDLV
jgi:hypothetical protein